MAYGTHTTPTSEAEKALHDKLDTLEYPRMVNHADGTQTRVENSTEAKKALAEGATLLPTAPAPHDGGTPSVTPAPPLAPAIQQAITSAVAAAHPAASVVPTPAPHPAHAPEPDDDEPKRKR